MYNFFEIVQSFLRLFKHSRKNKEIKNVLKTDIISNIIPVVEITKYYKYFLVNFMCNS